MLLRILKNSYEFIKKFIISPRCNNKNNDLYPANYQGHDTYNSQWFIGVNDDKKMQLWAIIRKRLIHNAGYYEPYRKVLIIKNITNWKL